MFTLVYSKDLAFFHQECRNVKELAHACQEVHEHGFTIENVTSTKLPVLH